MNRTCMAIVTASLLLPLHFQAAEPAVAPTVSAPEDPVHAELRTLRTNVIAAIAKGDIDRQLEFVHTNVVVTWQNSQVARGHQGLRDFYAKMGKDSFKGYKVPPTPDALTIIYGGDTGVAFGESVGEYNLFGRAFEFKNRWTATVVKDNGRWQLAGYHVSLDALNNPLINAAKRSLFVAGGLAGAIGLVLGIFIGRSTNRAATHPTTST